MTSVAVVAGAHDAKFAEEVRAGLRGAGLDSVVSPALPQAAETYVILIWGADLEAAHSIDAQALIGLWSEERLLVARRDATALPLGLRDLPSLSPTSTAAEICAAFPRARYATASPPVDRESQISVGSMADFAAPPKAAAAMGAGSTGSQEVEFEFWRAIKDGNDPDDFELYVQQFPTGIYAALAKRKLAKLLGKALPELEEGREQEQRELEEAARREAEIRKVLAEEKATLGETLSERTAMEFSSAVLFADVSGGRQLHETAGDRVAKAAIDDCIRIMRVCTEATKGRVIKTVGDEVMALFPNADVAADAAIQMQASISELKPVGNTKVGIRIGLHFGPVVEHADGEILGDAVTVASRLCRVAVKGQIITERNTVMSMAPILKSATRKITSIQIKGTAAEVYELMWQQSEDATTMANARLGYRPKLASVQLVLRGREHLLSSDGRISASVGSSPEADLMVEGRLVSPLHCKIERRLDKFVLTDLSHHGTFVTVDGKTEIVLRREEFTLHGRGSIALGQSRATAADVLAFACDGLAEGARAKKEAEAPKVRMLVGVAVCAIIAVAAAGGGAWYFFNKASLEKQAALTAALETATKASQELQQAQAKQQESLKAQEEARAKEIAALKSGDATKIKEAQEAAKRAEAEAAKQADAVKQREAAAADARKKALDSAESAKKTAQKAGVPTAAPAMESPKQEAPKAEVPRAEVPTAKASPQPDEESMRPKSRSERERIADDEAARAAATTRGAEHLRVAPLSPSAPTSAGAEPTPAPDHDALYLQAVVMEKEGRGAESIRIYRRAARAGSGKAALRLSEIYDKGIAGVSRDYAESLQWYETARRLGEKVEFARARDRSEAPVVATPAPAPEPRPVAPESVAVAKSEPIAVPPAPVIREAAKSEPAKAAVKSAPASREPAKPGPVPAVKPVPAPEPVNGEAPPPLVSAPALEPVKTTPQVPPSETKTGWFTIRGLLIALFVLALIAWRRSRRRKKAEARREQREYGAATNVPVLSGKAASRPVYKPSPVAPQGDAILFVSYSHKDRSRVEPIVSVIEAMGRRVWMDRSDITGQTGWAGQIVRAIRECRAVVLMASPNSYTSDQVVRELYLAMNHKKTIVPIEIEPAELPDELQYILAPFQHHRLSGRETREVIGRALAAV